MAFDYEYQMVKPAKQWLQSQGLQTKREFPTPWGICDLVGCSFNKKNVKKRCRLGQKKPIGSYFRVMLLDQIPDESEKRGVTLARLVKRFGEFFNDEQIAVEIGRLEKDGFVQKTGRDSFQSVNGWMPLHKKFVALELKLSRVQDALRQAVSNLEFADESYVGLPMGRAQRLINKKNKAQFLEQGIGVLAVGLTGCKVLLRSKPIKVRPNEILQRHCVERFWRTYPKDS